MMLLAVATALLLGQSRDWAPVEPGSLLSRGPHCIVLPLKHTSVNADISGFGANVSVVQTFTNPANVPIEAVYTFPLPAEAAVDRMRMKVGERVIDGVVRRREEARMIYEAAKNNGQAAALLDQERPNIFTQSVANIMPHATVQIEIGYVETIKYEDGEFEFSFPMTVGPRYLGNAPDPSKIDPPRMPLNVRAGADIELTVNIDAGAPIDDVKSVLHQIWVHDAGPGRAKVTLRSEHEIPNRDFILQYQVPASSVRSSFVAKYDPLKGGYFALALIPPKAPEAQMISAKEMLFVMDQSGSQQGFPIEKSKELTLRLIDTMHPNDTFNVMGFNVGVNLLWPSPRTNTAANRAEAKAFVTKMVADGGTELNQAVIAALSPPPDPERTRIVLFNTDGFIGDEAAVLQSIRENRGATRMFTFGIGNGVNRFLIDAMSNEGRGDSEMVTLASDADAAVARFARRLNNPILLDVSAKFSGVEVTDQLPSRIPDVFGSKPIVIYGRYATPGPAKLTISGTMAGRPWSRSIDVTFPSDVPGGESIPTFWARQEVEEIERNAVLGEGGGTTEPSYHDPRIDGIPPEAENKIVDLACEYGISSDFTSFVAVEQRVINIGGRQRTVHVPVAMTSGVSMGAVVQPAPSVMNQMRMARGGSFGGTTAGTGTGTGTGTGGGFGGGGLGGYRGASAGGGQGGAGFGQTVDRARRNVYVRHADPTFIASLDNMSPEQRANAIYEMKVSDKVRKQTGKVEVEVWLDSLTPELVEKLEKLGLTVDVEDKSLKVLFGTCDAKVLKALAQVLEVERIEPIT